MRQEEDEDMHSIGGNEANNEQEITFISKEGKGKCMAVPQYPQGVDPRISMEAQVLQLALRIRCSTSTDSTNPGSCNTTVFTEKKKVCIKWIWAVQTHVIQGFVQL